MGGCLGSCLGSCLATSLCSIKVKSKTSRAPFLVFFLLNSIIAVVMKNYSGERLKVVGNFSVAICPNQDFPDVCLDNQAVYRVCFALSIFFLVHAIMSRFLLDCHNGCWPLKIIAYVGGLVGVFFMPFEIFVVFVQICKFFAAVFIIIQIALLISFAYNWNSSWVEKQSNAYFGGLVFVSVLLYLLSIAGCALCFYFYTNAAGETCSYQKTLISVTIISCFILSVISVTEWCDHGALLPASVVSIYCTYLLYSALHSDPSQCNSIQPQKNSAAEWVGIVLVCLSLCYAGYSFSKGVIAERELTRSKSDGKKSSMLKPSETAAKPETGTDLEASKLNADVETEISYEDTIEEELDVSTMKSNNAVFHFGMMSATMYIAMLFTNWGVDIDALNAGIDPESDAYTASNTVVWIKIASQWVTILLFGWTLIAPKVLSGREF